MGINAKEFLGGNFLKKEDLETSNKWVVLNAKKAQLDGQNKLELEVQYQDFKKGFTLNVENTERMIILFGGDTDEWLSKLVVLKLEDTKFKGESMKGIRIDVEATKAQNAPSQSISEAPTEESIVE